MKIERHPCPLCKKTQPTTMAEYKISLIVNDKDNKGHDISFHAHSHQCLACLGMFDTAVTMDCNLASARAEMDIKGISL